MHLEDYLNADLEDYRADAAAFFSVDPSSIPLHHIDAYLVMSGDDFVPKCHEDDDAL